jgi:hypothetical protein
MRWSSHRGLLPVPPIVRPRALSRIRNSAREIMVCSAVASSRISLSRSSPEEVPMPRYEFFCRNCKRLFSGILSLVDYEGGGPLSALRQQEHRAVLVGLQRHYVEEERLIIASSAVAPIPGN